MTKPGCDDGIDDERRLEERPHMKKKNMGGGKKGQGRIMRKGGKRETTMDIQEQPKDPEVNGDGWWVPVYMEEHGKKMNSGKN